MTISIEEMRSFAAVAAQGTFSAAARALGRSQSVVSTHIAGMENELGIRLFVRGTPAKLTPAGPPAEEGDMSKNEKPFPASL